MIPIKNILSIFSDRKTNYLKNNHNSNKKFVYNDLDNANFFNITLNNIEDKKYTSPLPYILDTHEIEFLESHYELVSKNEVLLNNYPLSHEDIEDIIYKINNTIRSSQNGDYFTNHENFSVLHTKKLNSDEYIFLLLIKYVLNNTENQNKEFYFAYYYG